MAGGKYAGPDPDTYGVGGASYAEYAEATQVSRGVVKWVVARHDKGDDDKWTLFEFDSEEMASAYYKSLNIGGGGGDGSPDQKKIMSLFQESGL